MNTRDVTIFSGERFEVPPCIQRIDHLSTHGWQLRYGGTKLFSDHSNDGSGARRALALAEQHLGAEHPDVATLYHNLGGLDHARGHFAAGEPAARRAVEIRQRALAAGHPQVTETQFAADLAALAGVLDGQRKYAESEPIYERVLALFEQQLAAGDAAAEYEIAINLNNLAALYANTQRAPQAEPLYRRALMIKERLLGATHPDVAVSLNNLGVLLKGLGRVDEAAEAYGRALAIFEATLAADHPKLKAVRANLLRLVKGAR